MPLGGDGLACSHPAWVSQGSPPPLGGSPQHPHVLKELVTTLQSHPGQFLVLLLGTSCLILPNSAQHTSAQTPALISLPLRGLALEIGAQLSASWATPSPHPPIFLVTLKLLPWEGHRLLPHFLDFFFFKHSLDLFWWRSMWDLKFPDQGSNPCPLHWEHGFLTTGLPGKAPRFLDFKINFMFFLLHFEVLDLE